MAPNGTLSRKQAAAVVALLQEPTIEAAALACGASSRTLKRWLQEPAFQRAMAAAQRDAIRDATRRLAARLEASHRLLADIIEDEFAPLGERRRAAQALDAAAFRWRQHLALEEIEQRLDALESKR